MCQLAVEALRQRLSAFLGNKMAIEMVGRKPQSLLMLAVPCHI
jgi:hypothetical protein